MYFSKNDALLFGVRSLKYLFLVNVLWTFFKIFTMYLFGFILDPMSIVVKVSHCHEQNI